MTNRNDKLTEYFKLNYSKLISVARRRVGNYSLHNAEDAVQEAFCRACLYYKSYNDKDDLNRWFRSILTNCINQIKKEERERGVSSSDVEEVAAEPVRFALSQNILDLIKSLSPRDQRIIVMYFTQGYRSREVHEILGVSHDVVRDVIRRFRIKLQ